MDDSNKIKEISAIQNNENTLDKRQSTERRDKKLKVLFLYQNIHQKFGFQSGFNPSEIHRR